MAEILGSELENMTILAIRDKLRQRRLDLALPEAILKDIKAEYNLKLEVAAADVKNLIATIQGEIEVIESVLKAKALKQYEADPEKKKAIAPGIGVKVFTDHKITSVAMALKWATQAGICIKLEEKQFIDVAKKTPELARNYLTETSRTEVQISAKLDPLVIAENMQADQVRMSANVETETPAPVMINFDPQRDGFEVPPEPLPEGDMPW